MFFVLPSDLDLIAIPNCSLVNINSRGDKYFFPVQMIDVRTRKAKYDGYATATLARVIKDHKWDFAIHVAKVGMFFIIVI